MAVPNIFGSATSAIPLSQLDQNFATAITLGNTAVYLGNTTTSLGNVTLTNVTVSSGNVTVTGANVSGNLTFTGTGNRITGDFSNATFTNRVSFQSSTTNGTTVVQLIPNGTSTSSQFSAYGGSDILNTSVAQLTNNGTEVRIASGIFGTGTYLPMTFYTGGSERMRIDTAGITKFRSTGSAYDSTPGDGVSDGLYLQVDSSGIAHIDSYAGSGSTNLAFGTNSGGGAVGERMRIDSSGYVLAGYSSAFDLSPTGTGQYAGISISTSSSTNWKLGALSFSADTTANGLLFVKSRSATVGTNTVVQSGDALGNIVWRGADGTNYINAAAIQAWVDGTPGTNDMPGRITFSTTADGASSLTERMRIDSSGNLLVGKTATSVGTNGFEANASGMFATNSGAEAANFNRNTSDGTIIIFRRSSSAVGTISVTTTATAYNTSSDYRLKHNIAPMTGALAKVSALNPVTYKWNADDSDGEGFIAHELAEVVPQCVTGEKDAVDAEGNPIYQGIDTSFLVATLTAAIQEQQALITQLQADVATLKGQK